MTNGVVWETMPVEQLQVGEVCLHCGRILKVGGKCSCPASKREETMKPCKCCGKPTNVGDYCYPCWRKLWNGEACQHD